MEQPVGPQSSNANDQTSQNRLQFLTAQRDIIIATIARFNGWFSTNHDTTSLSLLKLRSDELIRLKPKFNDIQSEIEFLDKDVSALEHDNCRDQFEVKYFELLSEFDTKLAELSSRNAPAPSSEPNNSNTNLGPSIQLAPINIKPFSGHYTEWLPFFNTFKTLVHADNRLTNIQKFHHLKNSLKGDALSAISALPICNENYATAWQLLQERFQNNRLIVQHYVSNLFKIEPVIRDSSASLRQMLDQININVEALKSMDVKVENSDMFLIHIITSKLDFTTRKTWEESQTTSHLPTVKQLLDHLKQRSQLLEALELNPTSTYNNRTNNQGSKFVNKPPQKPTDRFAQRSSNFAATSTKQPSCHHCKRNHLIYNCSEFLKLSVMDRIAKITQLKLCLNCLKTHVSPNCRSHPCKLCSEKHNTLLHQSNVLQVQQVQPESSATHVVGNSSVNSVMNSSHVLLSTVVIKVKDNNGELQSCRAFLDAGSQSNFILKDTCDKFKLRTRNIDMTISGIQNSVSKVNRVAEVDIYSNSSNFNTKAMFLVVPAITTNLPAFSFSKSSFKIPENIILADPNFNISRPIDLLIGAELFWSLMCVGQIKIDDVGPILQKTLLGWIIGGPLNIPFLRKYPQVCNVSLNMQGLEQQVERFWELDSYENKPSYTKQESLHEQTFVSNIIRNSEGRFQIRLPTNNLLPELGNSQDIALRRFLSLEKKLLKDAALRQSYNKFMSEYLELNHMQLVGNLNYKEAINQPNYFLPHHAVFKTDGENRKIRVVFDGSAKTSSNISINDALDIGPKIQNDILEIMLHFRSIKYAFAADICKMYRQILVHPNDRQYQQILWRSNPLEPIKIYQLNTVTYGMSSSPYAAIKCLQVLADEYKVQYPEACDVLLKDFYVDDVLSGADTIQEAVSLRDDLISVLSNGCFELAKWASNNTQLLPRSTNTNASTLINVHHKEEDSKTLGLLWSSQDDRLKYNSPPIIKTTSKVTKRIILSESAKIYDCLGLLGPITVKAKIMLQQLWTLKLSWDESVPQSFHSLWTEWKNDLNSIQNFNIPRYIFSPHAMKTELHCFADASEKAYGGAIYVRVEHLDGTVTTNLLCSKNRVAPLKNIQLPRLELCGALLVAQLCQTVKKAIRRPVDSTYFWTDSLIALSWISSPSSSLKTFVSNRVSEIQNLTNPEQWRHVPSGDNPADIVSRGSLPHDLIDNNLWWHGPYFLSSEKACWPAPKNQLIDVENLPERKTAICNVIKVEPEFELLTRYSSFNQLRKTVAYARRFSNNARNNLGLRKTGPLSCQEFEEATITLVKLIQKDEFASEIQALRENKSISAHSKLLPLNPFLDSQGLLRVGGRLINNTQISEDQRHPYLLPQKHFVTKLIITYFHNKHLHAGAQLTLAAIRQKFWIPCGLNAVKHTIKKCHICFKAKPPTTNQLMGNLPQCRITPCRPFSKSGLDYAGPIDINLNHGRGKPRISKSYICVFVCMVTKASHLELVLDATTESFLNALKRFISRRGRPNQIHCDNSKTFVGADNELKKLFESLDFENKVIGSLSSDGIEFHFIPPRSPHMGGLWESSVKSTKHHLKRSMGECLLYFDEMQTLLIQIEACLNSRPLTPISNDPKDLLPLTPGHFLIGTPLTQFPEPNFVTCKDNQLSRWQRVAKIQQQFWNRWSKEYLSELQSRNKWRRPQQDIIQLHDLVVLKEDNVPPLAWKIGRVIETHAGKDGLIRVVSIKTATGVIKRPIVKVCVLPRDTDHK